jgi:hypothetical protein
LNGEPGELAACPGSTGAELVAQLKPAVVPGWPVVGFCIAPATPAGTTDAVPMNTARQSKRRNAITEGTSYSAMAIDT